MSHQAATRKRAAEPGPARMHLRQSRAADFFTEKELVTQTGHAKKDWPLVVLKELMDNALDACEDKGIAPEIHVLVDQEGITVSDNGPGIPPEVVRDAIDFSVRVSSRAAYVAPDRGKQGNALKTIFAMPYVLDGQEGTVEVTAAGVRHVIAASFDRLQTKPVIRHETHATCKKGTVVSVPWPEPASYLLADAKARFLQLAESFHVLNPHLTLSVEWFGELFAYLATNPAWPKRRPCDGTSAYWYRPEEDFCRLLAAVINDDQENGRDRPVSKFIAGFDGLAGTVKQAEVLKAAGMLRTPLSDLALEREVDRDKAARLLDAMKAHSRSVKPRRLGLIGKDHLRASLERMGCDPDSIRYKHTLGETDGLPWVAEVAFGYMRGAEERRLVAGVNWSPGIHNPFRTLGSNGCSLDGELSDRRAGHQEPIALVVHLACPRVEYTDHGKSQFIMVGSQMIVAERSEKPTSRLDSNQAQSIVDMVAAVTKEWTKQRKAEERQSRARERRLTMYRPTRKNTLLQIAFQMMPEAYRKASTNGTLPAHARQIMYAARGPIQERTGEPLNARNFTQKILPRYLREHPETAEWDVVWDARGHFTEPHTGRVVPLGTIDVRKYAAAISAWAKRRPREAPIPGLLLSTCGPRSRYGAILFVEKEGFMPLFERVRLADRYDLAIMSTKGMSVTAARTLADKLCHEYSIPLLVLHDFDKAGFSIANSFRESNERYTYKNPINVIDLGLRLADVEANGLESERFEYPAVERGKVPSDPSDNLRKNGATQEEMGVTGRPLKRPSSIGSLRPGYGEDINAPSHDGSGTPGTPPSPR